MKKKYLQLVFLMAIYLIGYILCKYLFGYGAPLWSYTAAWLFGNHFMFTWVFVIVLFLLNKTYTASFITFGCFLGIVVGQVIGNWIITINLQNIQDLINNGVIVTAEQEAFAHLHYGVWPIWFIVMLLSLITGLILDHRSNRKKSNSIS